MVCDALNDPIILNKVYGYSQRVNGILQVIVGAVEGITSENNRVCLNIISRKTALYGNNVEASDVKSSKVFVYANSLFPVEVIQNPFLGVK